MLKSWHGCADTALRSTCLARAEKAVALKAETLAAAIMSAVGVGVGIERDSGVCVSEM